MIAYPKRIFNAVTLTAAYADNTGSRIDVRAAGCITILGSYTTGATETNNTCNIQIEYSPDGSTWWPVSTTEDIAGAAASTNYKNDPQLLSINANYIRFSAKETGVAANFGTLTLYVIFSGKAGA